MSLHLLLELLLDLGQVFLVLPGQRMDVGSPVGVLDLEPVVAGICDALLYKLT